MDSCTFSYCSYGENCRNLTLGRCDLAHIHSKFRGCPRNGFCHDGSQCPKFRPGRCDGWHTYQAPSVRRLHVSFDDNSSDDEYEEPKKNERRSGQNRSVRPSGGQSTVCPRAGKPSMSSHFGQRTQHQDPKFVSFRPNVANCRNGRYCMIPGCKFNHVCQYGGDGCNRPNCKGKHY